MVPNGEKGTLITALPMQALPRPVRSPRSKLAALGLVALLASVFAMTFLHALSTVLLGYGGGRGRVANFCPQSDVLYPEGHVQLWKSLGREFDEDAFMMRTVAWLGGAVRIPCVLFFLLMLSALRQVF